MLRPSRAPTQVAFSLGNVHLLSDSWTSCRHLTGPHDFMFDYACRHLEPHVADLRVQACWNMHWSATAHQRCRYWSNMP